MGTKSDIYDIIPFEDSRGALKKILTQSQLETGHVEEVYLLYTVQGCVRGNHYHKNTLEYFTVVSGRAVILLKDLSTGVRQELKIAAADNKVVKVLPGVAHAIKNDAAEPLIILAVSTKEYDRLAPDTFAADLI